MRIALASPAIPHSLAEGLDMMKKFIHDAAAEKAAILCFPESFLPGYPGMGYTQKERERKCLESALQEACEEARTNRIAIVLPMDWWIDDRLYNVAHVINADGTLQGYQTKNQLDPSEDDIWTAGHERNIFKIDELTFGISICHEGFRYPETVRWAARRGAQLVFHPHFAGSDEDGYTPQVWTDPKSPYYEKAMVMRSVENSIYFASVNYSSAYPESATAVINPDGSLLEHAPYGRPSLLIVDIDPKKASGFLAKRLKEI